MQIIIKADIDEMSIDDPKYVPGVVGYIETRIRTDIEDGHTSGPIRDRDGNRFGWWELAEGDYDY